MQSETVPTVVPTARAAALAQALQNPHVWRANSRVAAPAHTIATGFNELDRELGGGWPRAALTEILFPAAGSGELRLLMPALAQLSRAQAWLAWIAPPYIPYAPALAAHGVDLARVMVVQPRDDNEALWAVEQALRAGTCAAVLAWIKRSDDRSLRRLQLAAEAGNSWGVMFRTQQSVIHTSPAALRLKLEPQGNGAMVQILKRRGAWPGARVALQFTPHAQSELAARREARRRDALLRRVR